MSLSVCVYLTYHQHITNLLPRATGERMNYSLRTSSNISIPRSTTESLNKSYLPSTIKDWNLLPRNIRELPTLEQFKNHLTPVKELIPRRFYSGHRKYQIIQTRMRLGCSDLKEDLFNVNLSDSPLCSCGRGIEDAEHFLIYCTRYQHIRDFLIANNHINIFEGGTDTMLFGDDSLSEVDNIIIFSLVHKFIKLSKRFDR